jgi:hypothetical protein
VYYFCLITASRKEWQTVSATPSIFQLRKGVQGTQANGGPEQEQASGLGFSVPDVHLSPTDSFSAHVSKPVVYEPIFLFSLRYAKNDSIFMFKFFLYNFFSLDH